jgi:cytosine/uracil/thiamine/allantoin permease
MRFLERYSMSNSRKVVALLLGVVLCILAVTPFALVINRFDWGVSLLLVAPLLVWLLLRAGRALERWANAEDRSPPPDPDFPDDLP